jgi:hypothetical protein
MESVCETETADDRAITALFAEIRSALMDVSASHAADSRCICTDGREAERDVCEPCT